MKTINEIQFQKILIILIAFFSIGPIILFFSKLDNHEKKIIFLSSQDIEIIDSLRIVRNDFSEKIDFVQKSNNWFMRVGEIYIPVSFQFMQFLNNLTETKKVKLISKKIKDWEKYSLKEPKAELIFLKNNTSLAHLYIGLKNEEKNEIYFRNEKSTVYKGEDFFYTVFSNTNFLPALLDTKWLPSYLALSRNSIQNIRIETKSDNIDGKIFVDRILGSSGALIFDIDFIKNIKPSIKIKIENDDTKEFEILIYYLNEESEMLSKNQTSENSESNYRYIVIPPNANYGLEISYWSIEQILNF